MFRKKDFEQHVKNVESLLDSDDTDEEEWESELAKMDDEPDTNIEDINADDVAPPSTGHIVGDRGLGTSQNESLEDRLCAIMEQEMMDKDWRKGGGSLKAIQPVTPIGTASKHTKPSDKQDGKSSREIRQNSEPAKNYNKYRNAIADKESMDTEDSEEDVEEEVEVDETE